MESMHLDWNERIGKLSKSQQKIANFILKAPERIPFCTEEDIAKEAGVSIASVSRFWSIVGFENLKAFKKHIQETEQATPMNKMKRILDEAGPDNVPVRMMGMAALHLEETARRLDTAAFDRAVTALDEARTVYAYGAGSAACLTELLAFRLNRIGVSVRRMAGSGHELFESLTHAGQGDVVLLFGFVQRSPETTVLLEQKQNAGYRTILVTDLLVSDMFEQSDIVLQVDRGDVRGFHSLAAPMAVVDALAVALTGRRGEQALDKLQGLHHLRRRYASLLPK